MVFITNRETNNLRRIGLLKRRIEKQGGGKVIRDIDI